MKWKAIAKGPHVLAQDPRAGAQFRTEAQDKARHSFCNIMRWADIRDAPPMNLKISPITGIPHKSRLWRAILDLSFDLMVMGQRLPSVNK